MKNKIFFLDAYALIFRAYYAFIKNPRINSKGLNTSAIFGFVNTLEEVLNKEKPSHIGVAFDPSGPNFRHEMYPKYKANREATPEDIKLAVPYIKQILEAYRIPVIQVSGFEADDVIGTLAKTFADENSIVYMMTPDKDYTQLVQDNILMYKPSRSGNAAEIIGVKEVKEKYGIDSPCKMIDILALWGDASDNVPGVPGVGEKTAAKLIEKFGNIDDIYININKIVGKQKEALEQNKEQLYLSRKLVTIKTDVTIDIKLDNLTHDEPDFEKLDKIFQELEFKTLSNRIIGNNNKFNFDTNPEVKNDPKSKGELQFNLFGESETSENNEYPSDSRLSFSKAEVKYKLIETIAEIEELLKLLSKSNEICIDTETTSLDTLDAEIIGLAISICEKEAYYVLMPGEYEEIKKLLNLFQPIFNDKSKLIIGQNLKYDLSVLLNYDITVKAKQFDTMIAHYLLQPEQKHNLDYLASKYLNYRMVPIESLIGEKGKNQKNMKDIDTNLIVDYSCEDADITLRLKNIFTPELKKSGLEHLFYEIEMPLVNVLIEMERAGVSIDSETINKYSISLNEELLQIEEKIFTQAGEKFNIASPKQLGIILFEKLKIINNPKKTKTKQYSTGEEELVKLTDKHPIINEILEYRSVNKLLNTYVDVLPSLVNSKTGKIHTSYNQAVTSTGRLSSNNPNLQNIPIREDRGRELRRSFIA
ncbi:MAG: DNA polymerase I, partial [Bacteroidales bacterium]|nr:DNA polymerase I [Bacteroidales bacterium]